MDAQTPSDDPHVHRDDPTSYRVERDDESLGGLVVVAVSAVTGRRPTDLPPIHESVDPDALESVFGPRTDGSTRRGGRVQFSFAGCDVAVDADAVTVSVDA